MVTTSKVSGLEKTLCVELLLRRAVLSHGKGQHIVKKMKPEGSGIN